MERAEATNSKLEKDELRRQVIELFNSKYSKFLSFNAKFI